MPDFRIRAKGMAPVTTPRFHPYQRSQPDDRTPGEIVADLHKQIAARSRRGAALVAAFDAAQAEKAAGIEAVRRAGREAWRARHEGEAR